MAAISGCSAYNTVDAVAASGDFLTQFHAPQGSSVLLILVECMYPAYLRQLIGRAACQILGNGQNRGALKGNNLGFNAILFTVLRTE